MAIAVSTRLVLLMTSAIYCAEVVCLAQSGKPTILEADNIQVYALAFSPDGKHLVSGGNESIRVWELPSLKEFHEFKQSDTVWCLAFAPDGKTLAAGDAAGEIRIWDIDARKERYPRIIHRSFFQ